MAAQLCFSGVATSEEDFINDFPFEKEIVDYSRSEDGIAFVKRKNIPALVESELFRSAWAEWRRFTRYGLPHGRGPDNERRIYMVCIDIMESEYSYFQQREAARRKDANSR